MDSPHIDSNRYSAYANVMGCLQLPLAPRPRGALLDAQIAKRVDLRVRRLPLAGAHQLVRHAFHVHLLRHTTHAGRVRSYQAGAKRAAPAPARQLTLVGAGTPESTVAIPCWTRVCARLSLLKSSPTGSAPTTNPHCIVNPFGPLGQPRCLSIGAKTIRQFD
jgi:hypothetical protein